MNETIDKFEAALMRLDKKTAESILANASCLYTPLEVATNILCPALERIGNAWQRGEAALSHIYMSGRICEHLIDEILPAVFSVRNAGIPKTAITVLADYHLLGKRIVYSAVRSAGFDLLDLGRTEVEDLVEQVQREGIEIILISTLMYPSALLVEEVRERLIRLGYPATIFVGGAPFNLDERLWQQVGANGMGRGAFDAVDLLIKSAGREP